MGDAKANHRRQEPLNGPVKGIGLPDNRDFFNSWERSAFGYSSRVKRSKSNSGGQKFEIEANHVIYAT